MAVFPGFCGPTARVRSLTQDCERTINFYEESAPGTPKAKTRLQATPCVSPHVVLNDGPIRGQFTQDGRAWAVSGSALYEVYANQNADLRGTAESDGKPATFASNGTNGNQLAIVSNGKLYVLDLTTNAIQQITTPDFVATPCEMIVTSDGYLLALKAQSNLFQISALEDFTTWDALDVYEVSIVSEQLRALAESHREIWAFGSQTTTVYADVGDADNPFQPIPGVKINQGIGAPYSVQSLDNTLYWLGGNEHGTRIVYRAKGYTPERISDHAVEFALNQYPRVDNAIGWSYQDEGHAFYVLYLPSPPDPTKPMDHTTWVYDVAENAWHERGIFDPVALRWTPELGRNHIFAFGHHLIGDPFSGAIYRYSLDSYGDTQVFMGAA